MAAAGQQDMITILWVYKFKRNEPWAYCMTRMLSIKESRKDFLGTVTRLNVFVNMNKKV